MEGAGPGEFSCFLSGRDAFSLIPRLPEALFFATIEKKEPGSPMFPERISKMKIDSLSEKELEALYDTRLKGDFPPSELRPFSSMQYLLRKNSYRCFAYWEGKTVLAYALFILSQGAALLDYFAVDPSLRGQGVGNKFLTGLKSVSREFGVPYVLIEAESVESAQTPEQIDERERRLRFYGHCGCTQTSVYSLLFGVEYQILLLPLTEGVFDEEEVKTNLEQVYRSFVPQFTGDDEEKYRQVCRCYRKEPETREFARELGKSLTFLLRDRKIFMGERLSRYGFSGPMYSMLLHVDRHPGATQDSIANHMYIDKSTVARRIKQMEELGYIRRETDLADRRQNNLYLTDSGKALVPTIRSYLSQWGQSVASDLTEEEQNTLLSLLSKILEQTSRNKGAK